MTGITMPSYDDLSEEQKAIAEDLAFDVNFLVTGPPGTGKTVVAMWRARMAAEYHKDVVGLYMYTKVLKEYSSNWEKQDEKVQVKNLHSWMAGVWQRNFGGWPPSVPGGHWADHDWGAMTIKLISSGISLGHIILDEAQDHPPEMFKALGLLQSNLEDGTMTVGILADENQQLNEKRNSSIGEIRDKFSVFGDPEEFTLTKNYRNTKQIALLASKFYTGLDTGIPEPPAKEGRLPMATGFKDLDAQSDHIVKHMIGNPSHSALVVCPKVAIAKKLYKSIKAGLKGKKVSVNGYGNSENFDPKKDLRPSENGTVTCVHWQSMKGIEADAVFIPAFDQHDYGSDDKKQEKQRLYVLVSRAREYLEFMY